MPDESPHEAVQVPDVDEAFAHAESVAGLSDWGSDTSWHRGLRLLLEAARRSDNPAVRSGVSDEVARCLVTRLRLRGDETQHPEIVAASVTRPIFIVGFPRTGTSYLHSLMALDPDARTAASWEARMPWPAPDVRTYESDERIQLAQDRFDRLLALRPEFASMHEWGAKVPAECQEMMMFHFASGSFWARFGVPEYTEWLTQDRPRGKYDTHRRVLQQLQWRGPRGRWTLKSPEHLFDLEGLVTAYPDACLVQTHREPSRVLASLASLVYTNRSMFVPGTDPAEVGASVRSLWGSAFERGTMDRANPTVDRSCIDVRYEELVSNPVETVEAIYRRFELPLTDVFRERLTKRVAQDRAERGGNSEGHTYRAEDFGLDAASLTGAFPAYRSRFGHLLQ